MSKINFVHVPFLGTDRNTIEKVRQSAKRLYPNWKRTEYIKPKLIKNEEFGDFVTRPEIAIYL